MLLSYLTKLAVLMPCLSQVYQKSGYSLMNGCFSVVQGYFSYHAECKVTEFVLVLPEAAWAFSVGRGHNNMVLIPDSYSSVHKQLLQPQMFFRNRIRSSGLF